MNGISQTSMKIKQTHQSRLLTSAALIDILGSKLSGSLWRPRAIACLIMHPPIAQASVALSLTRLHVTVNNIQALSMYQRWITDRPVWEARWRWSQLNSFRQALGSFSLPDTATQEPWGSPWTNIIEGRGKQLTLFTTLIRGETWSAL